MAFYCAHCGSRNHRAIDCSKKHLTYTPTAEELASMEAPKSVISPSVPPPSNSAPLPPQSAPAGPVVLEPPRWPGGPPCCPITNLGAFSTMGELKAFAEHICVGIKRTWQCGDHYHFENVPCAPAGTTSGTARDSVLPRNFTPFIRKGTLEAIRKARNEAAPMELPQQPKRPAVQKTVAPKPAPVVKSPSQASFL